MSIRVNNAYDVVVPACIAVMLMTIVASTVLGGQWKAVATGSTTALLGLGVAAGAGWLRMRSEVRERTRTRLAGDRALQAILGTLQSALLIVDERSGTIVEANSAACAMIGLAREQMLGCQRDWQVCRARQELGPTSDDGQEMNNVECVLTNASGKLIPILRTVVRVALEGRPCLVESLIDISDRKDVEEGPQPDSQLDQLTALPNRALLLDRLGRAIQRSMRKAEHGFAVLFLDCDRFKTINDTFGHEAGDLLLREVARRLRQSVRAVDSVSRDAKGATAARLGGDEFVILLDYIRDCEDALVVADRILLALSQPYDLLGREVYSTASIGIVASDMALGSADDILRDADTALYAAKIAGRGRYVVFDASMRDHERQRLIMESDLRRAVKDDQLTLAYQPVVSLETGRVESVEALLRWQHPERGLILPSEFIPVAEQCGLGVAIGEWVLHEACRQYGAWRESRLDQAPRAVSVNLSRAQLMLTDLPKVISCVLAETGVEPSHLHIEITETAVMQDPGSALRTLRALKELGVKLALDDFGTGYSALSWLHLMPLDMVKIDRSFVANINRGGAFSALVQAVVQLARNLGISVVAEGIETLGHLQMLQALGCQLGQGYLFSGPLTADEALDYRVDLKRFRPQRVA